jgi:periplasmic protein TonB
LPAYRLPSPYDRTPLQRRASGLALALGVNLLLLLVLLTLGIIPPLIHKPSRALIVDLIPESHNSAAERTKTVAPQATHSASSRPVPKPPPIVIPSKPTITPPHQPAWIEMSKDEMAASDVRNLARSGAGSGSTGDSKEVGRGPHGEVLYAAEWAREPTDAELNGYMPKNWTDGFGLVACKTIAGNRVEDCVELDQTPGSRFASAVRQAAWQFHVRPPRKGGHELVGSWVRIRIDYERIGAGGGP